MLRRFNTRGYPWRTQDIARSRSGRATPQVAVETLK